MKYKKIRGKKRRLKAIDRWIADNLIFDKEILLKNKYLYAKFRVDPWSRLQIGNSTYPEPMQEYRERIIEGLATIYDLWKSHLDKLNMDYYLKIWICFPHFRDSQVVCAIEYKIEYYENLFFKENKLIFPMKNFNEKSRFLLNQFKWEHCSHEEIIDDDYLGNVDDYDSEISYKEIKNWLDTFMNSPHRIIHSTGKDLHFYKVCDMWLGSK